MIMIHKIHSSILTSATVIVGALFGAAPVVAAPQPPVVSLPKPNIVHILTDDLGWQDIACYYRALHGEESVYETPHMDRLAQNGKRFMQAYSPAPTCAPSRAAYMAGQYTTHTGVLHVMGGRPARIYHPSHAYIDPYLFRSSEPGDTDHCGCAEGGRLYHRALPEMAFRRPSQGLPRAAGLWIRFQLELGGLALQ